MVSTDEMVEILDKVYDLPTLPTVYMRISNLMNRDDISVKDIGDVIATDQSITIKILRLVNSTFYGFSRKIVSIQQAIVLMGFNTIRNTVLSVSVFDEFSEMDNEYFNLNRFWQHSIACGIISATVDKSLNTGFRDEVFVSGLLHDIGKIILNKYFSTEFGQILAHAKKNHTSFYESERAIIGFSHNDLGEYLCDKWKLPFPLVESVALHHQPDNIRSSPKLVSIIHLADTFSYYLQSGYLNDFKQPQLSPFILEELDIKKETVRDLFKGVKQEYEKSMELFSFIN
ncbi:MAG TPA: HDOD domain-containing protein [Bacteroidetes bacterium]|nr:HDOD domain-containing protein [Bacteroidota bacterium]